MFTQNNQKRCTAFQCTNGQVRVEEQVACSACTFTQKNACYVCGGMRYVRTQVWRTCTHCWGRG
jgi:hypothetical protein